METNGEFFNDAIYFFRRNKPKGNQFFSTILQSLLLQFISFFGSVLIFIYVEDNQLNGINKKNNQDEADDSLEDK